VELERDDMEVLAQRVAELLAEQAPDTPADLRRLIDAAAVARLLGVSRATVYAKADELGAIRVGGGKRARLRFDPMRIVARASTESNESQNPIRHRRRRSSRRANAELLPIVGRRTRSGGPLRS
jgi:hypothetical protein